MKIKLAELQQVQQIFNKILNTPLDFKLSYRLGKITKKLVDEFKVIEDERMKLITKFGIKDEKKGSTSVPEDKLEEFLKEFNAILDTEIDLEVALIPVDLIEGIKLSANEVSALEKFVEPIL